MKLYYDFEHCEFITEKELFTEYEVSDQKEYYDSFNEYENACLSRNNGTLYTMEEYISKLQNIISKCVPTDETNIDELLSASEQLYKAYEFIAEQED